MSSGRRRKPIKTGTIIKIVIGVVILAAVIIVGMRVLRKKVDATMSSNEEETVQTAEVTTGSISTTVTGSGTLAYDDQDEITLPSTVEIEKYYVSAGDTVEQGELLASVNTTSLVTAMSEIQDEIDTLDESLADAEDETIDDEIDASVSGRVKKIYAAAGDDVANVMYENNALILLSLDGEMSVDVETDALSEDDTVDVVSDGTTYTGTVEKVVSGTATVTLTDNGPVYGADATVSKDGDEIGTGTLAIHRSLSVTGYAGTVSSVNVSENQSVSAGTKLLTLTDTSYTANYDSLLEEREDLEEQLEDLVTVYKEGAVYAQEAGTLVTLTKGSSSSASTGSSGSSAASGSSASGFSALMTAGSSSSGSTSSSGTSSSSGTDTVFSIAPDTNMLVDISVDESDILSLSVGQEATVTIDSLDDETFTGTVTEVGTEGTSSGGVTSYTAEISIPKDSSMLAGMSADASIVIEGTDNALLLPTDAVNKTSSTAYVYTSYDEESGELGDMVEVTVGISNSSYVEIKSGLSEGDTVYYKENSDDENPFGDFSDFGGMGGGSMPGGDSNGGGMGGGSMPSGGGNSGGGNGGGGQMPGGN